MTSTIDKLAAAGVAVWLDDLSRPRVTSGDLSRMVAAGDIVGITTNPTIFSKSISAGSGYEDQLRELALRGTAIGETLRLLTAWDVRAACDVLRPVYDSSDGRDGCVSIEVDPRISADADRTAAEARGLWWLVDRPNLFIKIPATEAALPAITASIADGISVNVTLIFSIDRYRAVLDAFMTGLEQRADKGADLKRIESVASFFVSRVDTEVDKRLAALPDAAGAGAKTRLHAQAALANARLAYEVYEEVASSARWQALADRGASLQRLLWASTEVKDKAFAPTRYVTELVARDTVNTMPEATLNAVRELDAEVPDTISAGYADARRTIDELAASGIDLADVADVLEREGLASFVQSWDNLIASVEDQLKKAGAEVMPAGAVKPASGDGASSTAPAAAAPSGTDKEEQS
ncbi:transaldolase [Sphingomonas nostoxanthinifaciens]|uniref:transaldolase n=1 Tax=Sphingomonas nostoxanthinifaciens TaxID=2872652 RepID=UPI001CC20C7F|nr:transaldolase [Sphingomonas nostoxanthinifaciens]UAK25624.1 transaldolase [Sphingomonas nostoxanthinifaciens]